MAAASMNWGLALGGAALAMLGASVIDQSLRCRRALAEARAAALRETYQRRLDAAHSRVLVLGDSTGAGIGAAASDESIPGLLAREHPQIEVLNLSVSGARIADVPDQLQALPEGSAGFDLLLLHVGGNDIMRARRLTELDRPAQAMVKRLRPLARRMLWLGPGDLGLAPLFRPPFNWWLTQRTQAAAARFHRLADQHDIHYVGFHAGAHREAWAAHRWRYFSGDGIHPSTEGYRYCYHWLRQHAVIDFGPGQPVAPAPPTGSTPAWPVVQGDASVAALGPAAAMSAAAMAVVPPALVSLA